ncbi:MAG: DNA adenine methylase [Chloroflexaceae bacterium]|jgi:DNA adenine methylase|nr:DNA adenine methylase [Chloroflexaceae bacterium]
MPPAAQARLLLEMFVPARPFLKWAGGKGQLLPELSSRLPAHFRRYHEPFVGGGAFFFHLANLGRLRHGAVLSDFNDELIGCYTVVRDEVEALIEALQQHAPHFNDPAYFLEIRSWDRQPGFHQRSPVEKAARTIFLNRTCYNGLYRLNNKGQFNAPFGYYKNPLICDPVNTRAVSAALKDVELLVGDFASVLDRTRSGDFVYFDPPYVPVSATASFTHYTGQSFGDNEQRRLTEVFARLVERGCHVMLSNSHTELARSLYEHHAIAYRDIVLASRKINCDGKKRGVVEELIVCSYVPGSAVAGGLTGDGRPKTGAEALTIDD